ncbi:MAG: 5-oxoprolinase subunit PxpA [Gammaproteobacteria bacterium]|nr:5-oxoprolinase subunit PxpA [Gammaproteobacteria bacterium]MDH5629232.1 5-oxoprolinase subunit PxpA [Gammaproteobacteria bacterium]
MKIAHKKAIDINCDLGEGSTIIDCAVDAKLMPFISSCNIACGGHAGNETTIKNSISNAQKHKLKIGAHPGYADKPSFGRKTLEISHQDLIKSIDEQLQRFFTIAGKLGAKVNHIKFHGALYNDMENTTEPLSETLSDGSDKASINILAYTLAKHLAENYKDLKVYGLANGQLAAACQKYKLKFVAEGFMDRLYQLNGKLTPRSEANAVHKNSQISINQALDLAQGNSLKINNNQSINIKVDTICLHGDNPNALTIAKELNHQLKEAGFIVR